MASKPPISSSLNPNAPAFVPASYLAAEDFSPEWWRLIQTSTSFREWWMKENEPSAVTAAATAREEPDFDDIDDLLELGFRTDILDDWDDHQAPVLPQAQVQVQGPAQQQRQQQVVQQQYARQQQQQQPSQRQNEHRNHNHSAISSHRLRTVPASESTGGVGYQNGIFPQGGKPQ